MRTFRNSTGRQIGANCYWVKLPSEDQHPQWSMPGLNLLGNNSREYSPFAVTTERRLIYFCYTRRLYISAHLCLMVASSLYIFTSWFTFHFICTSWTHGKIHLGGSGSQPNLSLFMACGSRFILYEQGGCLPATTYSLWSTCLLLCNCKEPPSLQSWMSWMHNTLTVLLMKRLWVFGYAL